MQIFIMRHGDANQFGLSDSQRTLTEQGELEASLMGKWLASNNVAIDHLLVSPYVRAQKTAEVLMSVMESVAQVTTLESIIPSGSAREAHDFIDGYCAVEKPSSLIIVAHMPIVSYLVSEMTAGQSSPIFQTAAIAELDYDLKRMKGHLVSVTAPSDLC